MSHIITNILFITLLLLPSAMRAEESNLFTITGFIPGTEDGAEVCLKYNGNKLKTKAMAGMFSLKGKISEITLAELTIDERKRYIGDDSFIEKRGTELMLEPANYHISAEHIDSVPLTYDMYTVPFLMQRNIKVHGGIAQKQYQEWLDCIYDTKLKMLLLNKEAHKLRYPEIKRAFEQPYDTLEINRLETMAYKENMKLDSLEDDFIRNHPDYAISLHRLYERVKPKRFFYTEEQYDSLIALVENNYDKAGVQHFKNEIDHYCKHYPAGTAMKDFEIEKVDGTTASLSSILGNGKYTLIDFWASWCGPCREAIPEVKAMHKIWKDKIDFISISVDKKAADWYKAVKKEMMPWLQLKATEEKGMPILTTYYDLKIIPTFIIITPERTIGCFASSVMEARQYIETRIK